MTLLNQLARLRMEKIKGLPTVRDLSSTLENREKLETSSAPNTVQSRSKWLKILGIFFGDLGSRNWEEILLKMRSKLSSYKCKCETGSLNLELGRLIFDKWKVRCKDQKLALLVPKDVHRVSQMQLSQYLHEP